MKPKVNDWNGVKRLLRYIKGNVDHKLNLKVGRCLELKAYADADWATDPAERKAICGLAVYLGEACVMWTSRKQTGISTSDTEAENCHLHELTKELVWLKLKRFKC